MRLLSFILICLTIALDSAGQTGTTSNTNLPDSFEFLTDTLIKSEIATFSFKGATDATNASTKRTPLTEIPLVGCDGKTVNFHKGTTYIDLFFKRDDKVANSGSINTLDSIFLVMHSHFWVRIPKTAYDGLSNIIPCDIETTNKKQEVHSSFFKSFQSLDRRRIYIYMIGGLDKNRYEVTWVIADGKFLTRTIDSI